MVIVAIVVFIIFIILAHAFAPAGYRWKSETVSRLADSGHPHRWILKVGMVAYGMLLIASTSELSLLSLLVVIYGLGVIVTAIFTVEKYKSVHMFSIYVAGGALVVAMFRLSITGDIISLICLACLLIAEIIFNIKSLKKWRGLSQRTVHLFTLIWLAAYGV
ncbi:MAG: DUF998 domain-containing protein [Spirochaetales bacterium]|nr:DUF998 domain-containing protein [Spirochaetales bacterium]